MLYEVITAMTSSRPYRKGCSRDEATVEIMKFRGTQFNPELTDIFLVALNDYEDVITSYSIHYTKLYDRFAIQTPAIKAQRKRSTEAP